MRTLPKPSKRRRGSVTRQIGAALTLLLLLSGVSAAQAASDWKYYGSASASGISIHAFYDVKTIKGFADGHRQVWTKFMDADAMNNAKLNSAELSQAVGRFFGGYRPPYASVHKLEKYEFFGILGLEAQANSGVLAARNQTLWEIDCAGDRGRTLATRIAKKSTGDTVEKSETGSWMKAAPESNEAKLISMICK
jgi:hypothetical protein